VSYFDFGKYYWLNAHPYVGFSQKEAVIYLLDISFSFIGSLGHNY
jgi:hypothetical protein